MARLTYGAYYFSSASSTTLSAATAAKAAGTTTAMATNDFTHIASNRLRYDGTITRTFHVHFAGSVTKGGGGSTESRMMIYKNGTLVTGAEIGRTIANASDEGAFAVQCFVSLATNDYVELWCETDTGDDLTVEHGVMSAKVIG